MVRDDKVRRQLEELEAIRLAGHRRAMTLLAVEEREDELAGYADQADQLISLRDLRIDDELLNGLLLIIALLP